MMVSTFELKLSLQFLPNRKQTKKLFHFYQRGIPSVVQLPLFGLETLLEDPLKINLQRLKKYGTLYGTYLGNMPIIVIADPEIAKVSCCFIFFLEPFNKESL